METTVINDGNPRRGKRRAKRRTSRRRSEANPRRRRRPTRAATRRTSRRNQANPRRRRRRGYRRNPAGNPELNLNRFLYATGGGTVARLAARKLAGLRDAEGKLTTMHYLSLFGAVYFGPDIADAIGASPDEARAFADGAAAIAGAMVMDQHLDDFSAHHLLPFKSPSPTGDDVRGIRGGVRGGMGQSKQDALPYDRYLQLAGMGQLPPGGVYVRGADGSVWWFPTGRGTAGVAGNLGAARENDLLASSPPGTRLFDDQTGRRYVVSMDRGKKVLLPAKTMGAGYSDYYAMVAGRH